MQDVALADREYIVEWAMKTFLVASEIALIDDTSARVRSDMAISETKAIVSAMENAPFSGASAFREFSKRVIRRANQIINDGIAARSVR